MNAAARVRREKVRIQAATMFEESKATVQIASELRVSEKSVRQWRRRWTVGGTAALVSAGPGGSDCKLSTDQQKRLAEPGLVEVTGGVARSSAVHRLLVWLRFGMRPAGHRGAERLQRGLPSSK